MRFSLIFFNLFFSLSIIAFSQETILIESDTTWGGTEDTIFISDSISVEADAKLTIEEGSVLLFGSKGTLAIAGKIIAIGSLENPIVFSAIDTTKRWKCIEFVENQKDTSHFDYCIIQYTYYTAIRAFFYNYINFSNCTFDNNMEGPYLVSTNLTLDNCKILNNGADLGLFSTGGLEAAGCSVTITNNIFESNRASHGGAMEIYGCDGLIQFNHIKNNISPYGSGLYLMNSKNCLIRNNIFHNNTGATRGGGINIKGSPGLIIENNIITNNSGWKGSGVYIENDTVTLLNNLIANNSGGDDYGGGLCILDKSLVRCINNTIVNNEGAIIFAHNTSKIIITNTILWSIKGIKIEAENCIFQNSFIGSQADFKVADTLNPLFVNPTKGIGNSFDASKADWNLQNESPCVNKGTPDTTGLALPPIDLNGKPRIFSRIDIGAFENQVYNFVIPQNRMKYISTRKNDYENNYNLQGRKLIKTIDKLKISNGFYVHNQNDKHYKPNVYIK